MRSNGSGVCAARSSSSLYSSSSHSLWRVFSGSFSCTGMATLDRSFPMLFLRMFHRLMLLVLGLGEGSKERRFPWGTPFSRQSKSRADSLDEDDYSWSNRMFGGMQELQTRINLKCLGACTGTSYCHFGATILTDRTRVNEVNCLSHLSQVSHSGPRCWSCPWRYYRWYHWCMSHLLKANKRQRDLYYLYSADLSD